MFFDGFDFTRTRHACMVDIVDPFNFFQKAVNYVILQETQQLAQRNQHSTAQLLQELVSYNNGQIIENVTLSGFREIQALFSYLLTKQRFTIDIDGCLYHKNRLIINRQNAYQALHQALEEVLADACNPATLFEAIQTTMLEEVGESQLDKLMSSYDSDFSESLSQILFSIQPFVQETLLDLGSQQLASLSMNYPSLTVSHYICEAEIEDTSRIDADIEKSLNSTIVLFHLKPISI